MSSAAPKKKKHLTEAAPFQWPPRSNAADDRLEGRSGGALPPQLKTGGSGGQRPPAKNFEKKYENNSKKFGKNQFHL